jgi:hypothetical protein
MRGRRGQAGIEYVMLTGLLLFFFIPLIHYSLQETNNAIKISQIDSYVGRLSKSVDAVHSLGPGSTEIIVVTVPKGVESAELINYIDLHEINVRARVYGGINDFHRSMRPNVGGILPKNPGTYHLKVKSINETFVNISIN